MRPESIRQFEYFYLCSIGVATLNIGLGLWASGRTLAAPGLSSDMMGAGLMMAGLMMVLMVLVAIIIPLVLWYLAARRANEVAKWFIVAFGVLCAFHLLMILFMLGVLVVTGTPTPTLVWLSMMLSVVSEILGLGGVAFLFPRDARAFFANRGVDLQEHGDIFA